MDCDTDDPDHLNESENRVINYLQKINRMSLQTDDPYNQLVLMGMKNLVLGCFLTDNTRLQKQLLSHSRGLRKLLK